MEFAFDFLPKTKNTYPGMRTNMERVLAISAHFDDSETGCGGTLLRHKDAGDEIYLAVLAADEMRTGNPLEREKEQRKVMEVLGAVGLLCLELSEKASRKEIKQAITSLDKINPTLIYAPHKKDSHQDHRLAHHVGQSVSRKGASLLAYSLHSSYDFAPNLFKVIDFEKKKGLISCFQSQESLEKLILFAENQNRMFGSLFAVDFAEGFVLHKMLCR